MIPLEDNVGDIIGKAQRGLGISDSELAKKAGVDLQTIRKLLEGDFDEAALLGVAPVLDLAADPLCELAKGEWRPKKIDERDGFAQFNTRFHDMTVNAYLVWDPASRAAAVFDTGADCSEMVRFASRHKLNVQLILLTHAHPDHVGGPASPARGNWRGRFWPRSRTCLRRGTYRRRKALSPREFGD